jgi:hypothetical protein
MEDVDRVHDGQTIYYKSSETLPGSLSLTVSAGGFEDAMFVHFNAEATTQFDGKYDAYKLSSYNEQVPQLYTVSSDNQNLAINGLPGLSESLQIPVYFKAGVAGQQSLTADVSQVPSTVYLTDLKTSFTQNLRQNPDYTFTAADGDAPNRFLLHFAGVGIGEPAATRPVTVYMSGNVLHVGSAGAALTGEVFVYNMMGQLVAGQKLDGSTTTAITLNVRTGYYLVKVVTTNDTFTSKIFIQ